MALHSRYAVKVSAAVATRSRADCSSMEYRRGNKRPYQPKHSPSIQLWQEQNVGNIQRYTPIILYPTASLYNIIVLFDTVLRQKGNLEHVK